MNQAEFLLLLRESLEGNIPQAELEDNIVYYREYFESSNCSDTEVCEELGDPRLIAKSIVEAYLASKGADAGHYINRARSEYSHSQGGSDGEYEQGSLFGNIMRMILWGVSGVVIFLVLIFVLRVAVIMFIPIVFVVLIWKLLRRD